MHTLAKPPFGDVSTPVRAAAPLKHLLCWAQDIVLMVPWVNYILGLRGKPVTKSGAAPATVGGESEASVSLSVQAVGKAAEDEDPRARRPAVSAESSSGGVSRWKPQSAEEPAGATFDPPSG